MSAAKLTGGFYVAAVLALAAALAISWRSATAPPPRLEVAWTLEPTSSAPTSPAAFPSTRETETEKRFEIASVSRPTPLGARRALRSTDQTEVERVEERLKDSLTQELYDNFKLFLFVSKAESGPIAQQMYVFRKQTDGDFALLYRWPVSTGREKMEISPAGTRVWTRTPAGYYELDPHRFYSHHVSSEWRQPMPYAMFFNWRHKGRLTGLAIHGATGRDVATLGKRASAGCIHLSPEAAHELYTLIRTHYRGLVPRFAVDNAGTMSNQGIVLHDLRARPRMGNGYSVLVIIKNYGGRDVVAAIY